MKGPWISDSCLFIIFKLELYSDIFIYFHKQTECGAQPASYPIGVDGSFFGSKAAKE
jgi:hypothetical protein